MAEDFTTWTDTEETAQLSPAVLPSSLRSTAADSLIDWSFAQGARLAERSSEAGPIVLRAMTPSSTRSLLERRYAWRGYRLGQPVRSGALALGAELNGRLVGTLGLRHDGHQGLMVDASFPRAMAELREQGYKLCEFTRLAVEPTSASKTILSGLFHLAYLHASRHWGTRMLVIEVNPRHVSFYRRMLGFRAHGEVAVNRSVGAPAVLMTLDLDEGAQQVARYGGELALARQVRSLYPYFFSPIEEPRLVRRLAQAFG